MSTTEALRAASTSLNRDDNLARHRAAIASRPSQQIDEHAKKASELVDKAKASLVELEAQHLTNLQQSDEHHDREISRIETKIDELNRALLDTQRDLAAMTDRKKGDREEIEKVYARERRAQERIIRGFKALQEALGTIDAE